MDITPKKAKIINNPYKDYFFEEPATDIYDNEFLTSGLDSDLISVEEQGFMIGYLGDCYV